MRRIVLSLILTLLAASAAMSQSTTVGGTVSDAGSQTWNNGTIVFTFVPNPQFPVGPYTWTGGAFNSNTPFTGTMNGSGVYSVSLPSNTAISPQGSRWQAQVTPNASSTSFTGAAQIITGGSQTINLTPPAIAINLTSPANSFITAYADAEIASATLGAFYFNVTSLATRTCTVLSGSTCATWTAGSGGGGTPCVTTALSFQYNNAGAFGCVPDLTFTAPHTIALGASGIFTITGALNLSGATVTWPGTVVLTNQANAYSTGAQDFSSATSLKLPIGASLAPTTAALIGYDTTNNRFVGGNGTNTSFFPWFLTAPGPGNCAQWSGTQGLLGDAGTPCSPGLSGLTTNVLSKAASSTTLTNSLLSDNGTTATYTGTGGVVAPLYTTNGTGAGATVYTAGTAQGHATASTVTLEAPPTIATSYEMELPNAAPTGGNTFMSCTAANPSVCSFAAASGGGSGIPFGPGAGSVNVMTVTTSPAVATNATGTIVNVQTNLANTTTTPTLSVGGASAQTIVKQGSSGSLIPLIASDYGTTAQNQYFTFISNGTNWILLNPASGTLGTLTKVDATGNIQCVTNVGCSAGTTNEFSTVQSNVFIAGNSLQGPVFSNASTALATNFTGGQDNGLTGGLNEGGGTFRGGNATGATGVNSGGPSLFSAGAETSAAGIQGIAWFTQPYFASGTPTLYNLQCESGSMTVTDCGASPTTVLGIAANIITPLQVIWAGLAPVNASAAVTLGHTVCAGTTAGKVTDSGGLTACTLGTQVGIVMAVSGTYNTPLGGTVTLSTTLPLVHMKVD